MNKAIDMMSGYQIEHLAKTNIVEKYMGKVYLLGHITGTELWRPFHAYVVKAFDIPETCELSEGQFLILSELERMKHTMEILLDEIDDCHEIEEQLTVTLSCKAMGHEPPNDNLTDENYEAPHCHQFTIGKQVFYVDDFISIKNRDNMIEESKKRTIIHNSGDVYVE
jgi:hypothetical protein